MHFAYSAAARLSETALQSWKLSHHPDANLPQTRVVYKIFGFPFETTQVHTRQTGKSRFLVFPVDINL